MTVQTDPSSTNASLIDRVRVDDSAAWRELVDLYGPLIAYWCRKLGLPERSIGDCVQNVFLAILRTLPTYAPEGREHGFRAWLWGITRHKCIDALRTDGRHPEPIGGSTAAVAAHDWPEKQDWSDLTDDGEITRLMRRAMKQVEAEFEAKTWRALWRTTVDGIATSIVAAELMIDPATVRKHRSRVLRRLRKQLGEV